MNVCIVGHGPSLVERPRGAEIDAHDRVVRLKISHQLMKRPEMFGSTVDAVCFSPYLRRGVRAFGDVEYWLYVDSRFEGKAFEEDWYRVDRDLCDRWNARYREMRTPFVRQSNMDGWVSSDEKGQRHMSAGTHAILYACEFWKPETISLAGFDNVVSGTWTWSLARGPDFQHYADHRFDIEREIVQEIGVEYQVGIRAL